MITLVLVFSAKQLSRSWTVTRKIRAKIRAKEEEEEEEEEEQAAKFLR